MTTKPQEILDLEKLLGVRIPDATAYLNADEEYLPLDYYTVYQGQVDMLVIREKELSNISFLENFTTLYHLRLEKNRISDFSGLEKLSAFGLVQDSDVKNFVPQGLYLNDNQISDISFLQNMTNLEGLWLPGNQITDILPLKNLTNLKYLDLSGNKISDISPLQNLTNLRQLHLNRNEISDISPLQHLTNLSSLELYGNEISDISPLQHLTNLSNLHLAINKISDISPLQHLTNLSNLNLEWNNKIEYFNPQLLNALPRLQRLNLEYGPIRYIPYELYELEEDNCLPALRAYLEGQKRNIKKHFELKMIVIGNGRVGKTSMIKRWLDNTFDANEASTHGVNIEVRTIDKNYLPRAADFAESVQLNVWDFGGQDMYHATHRLFMRTRAVFMILWDWETENSAFHTENGIDYKNFRLPYWLDYAKELGEGSPILMVRTKREQNKFKQIPLKPNEIENYNIKAILDTDALKPAGYEDLKNTIDDVLIEMLNEYSNQNMPLQWWNVRQRITELVELDKTTMRVEDFNNFCKGEDLDNEAHYGIILHYLHQIGFLFYSAANNFNNQIIINQKWAIDAVYTIFDRRQPHFQAIRDKKGRFTLTDLQTAWSSFDADEQAVFIAFMQSCKLCFETENGVYMAPAMMREEKSEELAEAWQDADYWVRYEQRFLHYGVIQQFIVETHQFGKPTGMWKNGTQLRFEESLALIEGVDTAETPYIQVQVRGNNPKKLLNTVRQIIENLLGNTTLREMVSIDGQNFIALKTLEEHDPKNHGEFIKINGNDVEYTKFEVFLGQKARKMDKTLQYSSTEDLLKKLLERGSGSVNIHHHHIEHFHAEKVTMERPHIETASFNIGVVNNLIDNLAAIQQKAELSAGESEYTVYEELDKALDAAHTEIEADTASKPHFDTYKERIKTEWFGNNAKVNLRTIDDLALGLYLYDASQQIEGLSDFSASVLAWGKAVERELEEKIARVLIRNKADVIRIVDTSYNRLSTNEKRSKPYSIRIGSNFESSIKQKIAPENPKFEFGIMGRVLLQIKETAGLHSCFISTFENPTSCFSDNEMTDLLTNQRDSLSSKRNDAAHPSRCLREIRESVAVDFQNMTQTFLQKWNSYLK